MYEKFESKIIMNKRKKYNDILKSATKLFLLKGFAETSVEQIVKDAKIAKGTFYLYFKDKDDLISKVILQRSVYVLKKALKYARSMEDDFVERAVYFADYIIEYFKKHKGVLEIINKNFSWGILRKHIEKDENSAIKIFIDECLQDEHMKQYSTKDGYYLLFILVELVGSVCYSSIINNAPDKIDNMKPMLFLTIRKMFTTNSKD